MAKVRLSPTAEKDLRRLPKTYAPAVAMALRALGEDSLMGKPLEGKLAGLRSRRVGVYRILYRFDPRGEIVTILRIEHRAAVYRG